MFRGKTAEADSLLAQPVPPAFASLLPRYEMLRGCSLARHRRTAEGQEALRKAAADAAAMRDFGTQIDALLWLGGYEIDPDAADAQFRLALSVAEQNHMDHERAEALMDLGFNQLERQQYARAIPILEQARDIADQAHAGFVSAMALNNLAECYENLGDLEGALEAQRKSIVGQEQSGLETVLSGAYTELGAILLKKGQTQEGIDALERSFHLVSKDAPFQYSLAAGNLADALLDTGALDKAEQLNQVAFKFASPKDLPELASLTLTEGSIAAKRGLRDQALSSYQKALRLAAETPSVLWQTQAALASLYATTGDAKNADKSYAAALKVIASNRADQLKSDYKITFLSHLIHFYQDYVDFLMQAGESDRALEIADSSRASVLTEDLRGQSTPSQASLISKLHTTARKSNTVFLFYWLAPKHSYVWALTATQTKVFPLPSQQQIEQDVTSYRSLIEEQKRDPLALNSPTGLRLFSELVAPAAELIQPNSNIVIVPDGALHNLNFETLLVTEPKPHYWIEDATISIAPSLSILQIGSSVHKTPRSLLLMGDPVTQGTGFPALPEAAAEISGIRRQFENAEIDMLTQSAATAEAYFHAHPERYSTIHFATHVDANARSPLDSAIILSADAKGYRLYARDVAEQPLSADLVTISACRSTGARNLSGEGLVGFAWAFFQARAHNVVTSLWDVFDQSTPQLMEGFYANVKANQPYARALRDAKLTMLRGSSYKAPYYWAPFQLFSRTLYAM